MALSLQILASFCRYNDSEFYGTLRVIITNCFTWEGWRNNDSWTRILSKNDTITLKTSCVWKILHHYIKLTFQKVLFILHTNILVKLWKCETSNRIFSENRTKNRRRKRPHRSFILRPLVNFLRRSKKIWRSSSNFILGYFSIIRNPL